MRLEVFRESSPSPEFESKWRDILASDPHATPFQSPDWHRIWWRHYGGDRRPLTLAAHEGNDLVGLYPLMRSRGAWRVIRPSGIGPADYLQPLIRPGYESALELFAESIAAMDDVDLVDLQQAREDKPSVTISGEVIDQARCLVLQLPPTYDEFLGSLGKSLRFDCKRLGKPPFSTGAAELETVGADDVSAGLEILFEQHRLRWRKRGLPGVFIGRSRKFHLEWAATAASRGWLRLQVLRSEGKPIGALYGMAMGGTTYFYQCGFDPDYKALSPGTLLVAHTIRQAIEEGRLVFDFMRGDEPYKRRWKPQQEFGNRRTLASAGTLRGSIGLKWNVRASIVEQRLRARFEGKGLR